MEPFTKLTHTQSLPDSVPLIVNETEAVSALPVSVPDSKG
jgi:hypothetical protein